jgi:AcrR family transcriptional regulator
MTNQLTSTSRFEKKREAILSAARDILYREGLKGMTHAAVAAEVGLNAAGITYYFRRKEDLAAACYLESIATLDAIIDAGHGAPDEAEGLRRVLAAFFRHHRGVREGRESPIASFGEVRALDEPHRSAVQEAFVAMSRRTRALFEGPRFAHHSRHAQTALAQLLLEQMFWAIAWLYRYDVEDYPRVLARTCDTYLNGVAAGGGAWRGDVLKLAAAPRGVGPDKSREDFFVAATRVINRVGYRNASVEKISAELNVTKGSFYHHIEAKEDLAAACFKRSINVIRSVQREALEQDNTGWRNLERATSTLVDFQFSADGPLMREGLLAALPEPQRTRLTERLHRTADRFAAMISDGVADGSVRAVDPTIAAHLIKVAINAAAEGPLWVRGVTREEAGELYAKPTLLGVLRR